jgi:hypothetical protein
MNCTSVGGTVKPWLIIKPETVTLLVIGVGVVFVKEVAGVSVGIGINSTVNPMIAMTIAEIITAKTFTLVFI